MARRILRALIILLPASILLSCGGEESPKKDLITPVSVKTVKATIQSLEERVSYPGTVQPIERVRLSTKIMGWVEAISFDEGDDVEEGVTLVKLRSKELEAKRAQAEAAISEAEAHYQNTETNYKRIQSLYEKKAATQKELDDITAAYIGAQARKKSAEEMKREVEEVLSYTILTVPFDGVVTRKMIEVGDLANPGQPILEVENTRQVKIVAKVPESAVQELQAGMPVQVEIQALNIGTNGKSNEGAIHTIVPSADPVSRQFDLQVLLDNSEGKIKSGMFARIAVGKMGGETLLVPEEAVFRRGQLQGLFVVDSENRAHLRWIRTGAHFGDRVEVLSGLNPGEEVVIEGALQLIDGQVVEVVP